MFSPTWIGERLQGEGRLSVAQYTAALKAMERNDERMEEALLRIAALDETSLLRFIAEKTQTHYLSTEKLAQLDVSAETLNKLPRETAEKLLTFPIRYDRHNRELVVVSPDAGNPEHVKQISIATGVRNLKAYVVRPAAITAAIKKWYEGEIQAFAGIALETFTQMQSTGDLLGTSGVTLAQSPTAGASPPGGAQPDTSAATKTPRTAPMAAVPAAGAGPSSPADVSATPVTGPLRAVDASGSVAPLAPAAAVPDRRLSDLAEMLNVLVALNENARDEFRGHSASVARLSRQVVKRMGLDETTGTHAAIAGNMHDLGKSVAYHLTAINITQYATHRNAARKLYLTPLRLLESIDLPAAATGAVAGMYERFDGQGLPAGLAGKKIPVGARILSLCDAYSDLTLNPRNPYRRMLSHGEALKVLGDFKGSLFDPDIVDILVQTIAGENLRRRLSDHRPVVLLVEPAAEEATIMELRLVAQGFDVKVARTAEQALDFVQSIPVGFVLSEVELQPFDGFELLSQLRQTEATQNVPFIFVSRTSDTAAIDRAFGMGAQDYVVKPTSGDVLAAKLKRVGGPKSKREGPEGISGSLSEMGLPDLSQILSHGRKSGKLTLRFGREKGEVHFESGRIVHATCRGLAGQDAFFELLGISGGSFSMDPGFKPSTHSITAGVESLILEGLRRLDEKNQDADS